MNTQQAQAATLSGSLCVTNYNDMNIMLNVIELAFNGTEKELWKTACLKFQELYALGLSQSFNSRTEMVSVNFKSMLKTLT